VKGVSRKKESQGGRFQTSKKMEKRGAGISLKPHERRSKATSIGGEEAMPFMVGS